jgi:L-galactose dehydrogenase
MANPGTTNIMKYKRLGKTNINVSALSFGASSMGGVFHDVDENEAIATVKAALDAGINYFDVAPAYGATRSETVLGKALKGVDRSRYYLSTKVGKYTAPGVYGEDTLDYSRARIRASIDESAARLGNDYFDMIYIHDIEYQNRCHTDWAMTEGFAAVKELIREGRVGGVGFGIYPIDLWQRILKEMPVDAVLVHNHYCLNDDRLLELLPLAQKNDVGLVNASPYASGLLTDRGPADWHPATAEDRAVFRKAADFCRAQGTSISKIAFQFASQNPEIPTTMFSTANRESLKRSLQWHEEPLDHGMVVKLREILSPVRNKDWF